MPLLRDPDALVLYALVALYLFLPEAVRSQVVDRLDDKLPLTLLALAGGGRFGLRLGGVFGYGRSVKAPDTVVTPDADAAVGAIL